MGAFCEEEEVNLSKKVHCFDLNSNEWPIAMLQIYEVLFKEECEEKELQGDFEFDKDGNVVEVKDKGIADSPTI